MLIQLYFAISCYRYTLHACIIKAIRNYQWLGVWTRRFFLTSKNLDSVSSNYANKQAICNCIEKVFRVASIFVQSSFERKNSRLFVTDLFFLSLYYENVIEYIRTFMEKIDTFFKRFKAWENNFCHISYHLYLYFIF